MKTILSTLALMFLFSCQNNAQNNAQTNKKQKSLMDLDPVVVPLQDGKARAYFASGCFWCAEAIFESVKGVEEATSGYSGGHSKNPTYEASNTGQTGHAEAIEVVYDPNIVDYATLIDVFFNSQDPTQFNGQGNDYGSQYRSIIFFQDEAQKEIAIAKKAELTKKLSTKVAAEIMPFQKFWEAEAYHQDFEKKNPNNPYIQNVSKKRLAAFKRTCPLLIKDDH
ncbi:peptide-methionine (S)-S-oxide reductase MsrA [Lacinutrix undariae]